MRFLFIDYTYFFIAKTYSRFGEKGYKGSAIAILSLVFASHVMTMLMLYSLFSRSKMIFENKLWVIVIYIFFEVINYFRYIKNSKHSIDNIEAAWHMKPDKIKVRYRLFSLMYVVLSIAVFIGLAIYLGSIDFDM